MCREESGDWLAGVAVLVAVCLRFRLEAVQSCGPR